VLNEALRKTPNDLDCQANMLVCAVSLGKENWVELLDELRAAKYALAIDIDEKASLFDSCASKFSF
jgi:hypothetical protein